MRIHETIHKYPRTQHVEGSKLQPGDEDLSQVPWASLEGCHLVVEEKVDGANAGLSFSAEGELRVQSRGHYLGGGDDPQFDRLKVWAARHVDELFAVLEDRYVLYGEWLYAKHTVFYDLLPAYLMEFDVYDRTEDVFLSTPRRRALLAPLAEGAAGLVSVRVLAEDVGRALPRPEAMIGRSAFRSADTLARAKEVWQKGQRAGGNLYGRWEHVVAQTDWSDLMEGLYIKWEEAGVVKGRYKFVRASFLQRIAASDSHWRDRPIFPNQLRPGSAP